MTPTPPHNSSNGETPQPTALTPLAPHPFRSDLEQVRRRYDLVLPGQTSIEDALRDTMNLHHPTTPEEIRMSEQQPEVNGQEVAEQATDAVENNSPVEVAGNGDNQAEGGQADGSGDAPGADAGTTQAQ